MKIIKPIKNKRGDLAITALVLMTLVICVLASFSFIQNSKGVKESVYSASLSEGVKTNIQINRFYMRDAGEKAFVKTYKEFVETGEYIKNPITTISGIEFSDLQEDINGRFKQKFSENFLEEIKGYPITGVFSFNSEEEFAEVTMESYGIKVYNTGDGVEYNHPISENIFFSDVGLESFQNLDFVKEICKNNALDKETCFSKLENFDVSLDGEKVTLTSKRKFVIDNSLQGIQFSFIPK